MEVQTDFILDHSVDPETLDYLVMDEISKEATIKFEYLNSTLFVGVLKGASVTEDDMSCQCDHEWKACGEKAECINRLVQMECHPLLCPTGPACKNRRFQKKEYSKIRIGDAGKKGYGIYAEENIKSGQFIIEYTGEMVSMSDFITRTHKYTEIGQIHHYFMSVDQHQVIDATLKGNAARFINHSCNPNCALQRWIVAGQIRMGIFALREIKIGQELSFDYKFERFEGSEPQKCYCGDELCKGVIGVTKEIKESTIEGLEDGESDKDLDLEIEKECVTFEQKEILRHDFNSSDDDSEYVNSEEDSDGDYNQNNYHGLNSSEEVLKLVQIMLRSSGEKRHIMLITSKLLETKNKKLLSIFVSFHGLRILRLWLLENSENESVIIPVLQCIDTMPIKTRNTVIENKIEPIVMNFCKSRDEFIADLAREIIKKWSLLKNVYKIPKRKPGQNVQDINLPNLSNQLSFFVSKKSTTSNDSSFTQVGALSSQPTQNSVISSASTEINNTDSTKNTFSEFKNSKTNDSWDNQSNNPEDNYSQKANFKNSCQGGFTEKQSSFGKERNFIKAQGGSRWGSINTNYNNPTNNFSKNEPSNQTVNNSFGTDFDHRDLKTRAENSNNLWHSNKKTQHDGNNFNENSNHAINTNQYSNQREYSNYKLKGGKKLKSGWYPAKSQDGRTYYYSEMNKDILWDPPYEKDDDVSSHKTEFNKNIKKSSNNSKRQSKAESGGSTYEYGESQAGENSTKKNNKRDKSEIRANEDSNLNENTHKKHKKPDPLKVEAEKKKKHSQEKKATSTIATHVVKALTRKLLDLDKDQFKHEAKKITKILFEKEKKFCEVNNKEFNPKHLIELSAHKIKKINDFITVYLDKLVASKSLKDPPTT
ncbi:hypothetical protein BB561_003651 [Smittium simulii]|uniref:[histone H3]-lysine(36) N-trimethyltransferase n=1 Tax=Smittium simulii TaxID=133385 RepID=A0A2T9YK70_9FUNG|nr:hypothetical protein BB561_003651 [Smittium simulii]